MTIDLNMLGEDEDLNTNVEMIYNAEMISKKNSDFHMLESMSHSEDMLIYISEKEYYKVEILLEEVLKKPFLMKMAH